MDELEISNFPLSHQKVFWLFFVSGVFWSFFRFRGYFGNFWVSGLFWSFFGFREYFGHFVGFGSILVIFWALGVFL